MPPVDETTIDQKVQEQTQVEPNPDEVILGGRSAIEKALKREPDQDDAGAGSDDTTADSEADKSTDAEDLENASADKKAAIPGDDTGGSQDQTQQGLGDDLDTLDPDVLWERAQTEKDDGKFKALLDKYKEKTDKRIYDTQKAFHDRGEELARVREDRLQAEGKHYQKTEEEMASLFDSDPEDLERYLIDKSRLLDLNDKEEEWLGSLNPKELIRAAKRSEDRVVEKKQMEADALTRDLTNTERALIDFVAETWNVKADRRRGYADQAPEFVNVLKGNEWGKVDARVARMFGNPGKDGKVRPPAGGFTKQMFHDAYKIEFHDRIVSDAVKKAREQVLSQMERAGNGGSRLDRVSGANTSKGPEFSKMNSDDVANLGYSQRKQYLEWMKQNNM